MQQRATVVADSPELVDFAIGVVNSVLNLPNGQVNFLLRGGGGVVGLEGRVHITEEL